MPDGPNRRRTAARFGDHGVGGKVPKDGLPRRQANDRGVPAGAVPRFTAPALRQLDITSPVAAPDAVGVIPAIVLDSQPKTEDGQLFQSRCGPHRSCLCFDASENICRN